MKNVSLMFLAVLLVSVFSLGKNESDIFEKYKKEPLLKRFVGSTVDIDNFVMLSEVENPKLSAKSTAGYLKMKERCKAGKSVVFQDFDEDNNEFIFICSSDEQTSLALADKFEKQYLQKLQVRGNSLKQGHVMFYATWNNQEDAVAVAIDPKFINSDIDPVLFAYSIRSLMNKYQYGTYIVQGCPVKLTLVKDFKNKMQKRVEEGTVKSVDFSKFVPTEQEITEAKSKIQ